jgi:hypothetical protein
MLPAKARLPDAIGLIARGQYFVVHAPRQTGKTTTLGALARALTAEGKYAALHFSCESAEPAQDDYAAAQRAVLESIAWSAERHLPAELRPPTPWPNATAEAQLLAGLGAWARQCPRPLVLFFDEIDALRGESLRAVLRQLRSGYTMQRESFPASVVLCGLRDVRDYKADSGGDPTRLGTASPFNIKVDSLRLGDFTLDEIQLLYRQHTEETGQGFADEALARAFEHTQGQPWLVNALAAELVDKTVTDRSVTVTADHVDAAKERLVLARATHLDSLAARLIEPRVRRVIEPLIAGDLAGTDLSYNDDIAYLRDLGLVAATPPVRVANPIYRDVIVRVLGSGIEENLVVEPRSFLLPDGRLNFARLLSEFAEFWRENGEVITRTATYNETAAQVVLMAFIHRLVDGGGYVDREYGAGMRRIDLLVRWPYRDSDGRRVWQREVIEVKVWQHGRPDPSKVGLDQLDGYLTRLDLDHGTLVVFDRRPGAQPYETRIGFSQLETPAGRRINLLRA